MAQQLDKDWRSSTLAVLTGSCFVADLLGWSATFTFYALSLCFAATWILRQIQHNRRSLEFVICTVTLVLAVLGTVGSLITTTLLTTTQYSSVSGQAINIINYPVDFFAFRICTMSALLGISISLALVSIDHQQSLRFFTILVRIQAVLGLLLYVALVLDIYLDSTLPAPALGPLACIWVGGWFVLAIFPFVPPFTRQRQAKVVS